jgi:hypothetical protein
LFPCPVLATPDPIRSQEDSRAIKKGQIEGSCEPEYPRIPHRADLREDAREVWEADRRPAGRGRGAQPETAQREEENHEKTVSDAIDHHNPEHD